MFQKMLSDGDGEPSTIRFVLIVIASVVSLSIVLLTITWCALSLKTGRFAELPSQVVDLIKWVFTSSIVAKVTQAFAELYSPKQATVEPLKMCLAETATFHSDPPPSNHSGFASMQCLLAMTMITVIAVLTGCATKAYQAEKVTQITTRGFGVFIEACTTSSGTPKIDIGYVSQQIAITPTSTNGPVNIPQTVNTFGSRATWNPFANDFSETYGTGSVATGLGSALASGAITPTNQAFFTTGATNSQVFKLKP